MKRKKKKLGRCCHLNMHGRRCSKDAVKSYKYHGDPQITGYRDHFAGWVYVEFCERHLDTD